MNEFQKELKRRSEQAAAVAANYVPKPEDARKTLADAVDYTVLVGGKRIRPLLMQAVFEAFGGTGRAIEPFMAAIEMIHSSSLAHDDLPCMDNDEYRRGNLTTWKKYGYDMAVLAGDALLVDAFTTASQAVSLGADPARTVKAIRVLGTKAGYDGMIGGQSVDVELTGKPFGAEELSLIYRLKTGALLEASMMIGCIMAGGTPEQIASCETIAGLVGLAFQVRDDILDETSTTEELGKPVGSDEKNMKTTYVSLYGLEAADRYVHDCTARAMQLLEETLPKDTFLKDLFTWLIDRKK